MKSKLNAYIFLLITSLTLSGCNKYDDREDGGPDSYICYTYTYYKYDEYLSFYSDFKKHNNYRMIAPFESDVYSNHYFFETWPIRISDTKRTDLHYENFCMHYEMANENDSIVMTAECKKLDIYSDVVEFNFSYDDLNINEYSFKIFSLEDDIICLEGKINKKYVGSDSIYSFVSDLAMRAKKGIQYAY
ncbi:MAG: hypothetical protein K6E11_04385 [Bacilli bacterium]|nr:hypothetical protein [Bacilli bacterium]